MLVFEILGLSSCFINWFEFIILDKRVVKLFNLL